MHIYLYVAAKNKYDSWDDAPSRAGKNSLMINTIYENSDAPSKNSPVDQVIQALPMGFSHETASSSQVMVDWSRNRRFFNVIRLPLIGDDEFTGHPLVIQHSY